MATSGSDIQIENGNYSRIHNAILEAIYANNFTARELKCLLFLLRKTYGYSKKSDAISYEQFADATGIARRHVISTMAALVKKNVVIATSNGTKRPQSWTFNKYVEQWRLVTKTVTKSSDQNSHQPNDNLVTKTVTSGADLVTKTVTKSSDQNSHPQKKEKKVVLGATATTTDSKYAAFVSAYERTWALMITPYMSEKIAEWVQRVPLEAWTYGLEQSVQFGNVGKWAYLEGILRRVETEGVRKTEVQSNGQPVTVDIAM